MKRSEQRQQEQPVEERVLAKQLVAISDHMKALLASGLTERAIVALLFDLTGVAKGTIKRILIGIRELKGFYTN